MHYHRQDDLVDTSAFLGASTIKHPQSLEKQEPPRKPNLKLTTKKIHHVTDYSFSSPPITTILVLHFILVE